MPFLSRPYTGETDKQQIIALRHLCSTPENVADSPSATDLYELLNPLRREQHRNIRLWEDATGQLIAYTNVFASGYFSFLIHPAWWQTALLEEALVEAGEILRRSHPENGEALTLSTQCRDTDEQKLQTLHQAGFVREADEVWAFLRPLDDSVREPDLPPGFRLRHVAGEQEVEQCVELHRAAFGTQNMTVEIRRSIMQEPDYDRHGDLVIEAPDGTLVAFCICSVHPEENSQAGRTWGYTDPVGVRPAFQGQNLGQAVVLGGLKYLQGRGMEAASFTTSSENTAMRGVGTAVGFRKQWSYLWLTKTLSSH